MRRVLPPIRRELHANYRLSPRHQAFFSASLASATLDGSTEGIARFLGSPFYHENSCGVWAMIPRYRLQPLMVLCRTLCRMISRVRIQQQTNDQSQIAPGERARRSCQVQFGNWSVRRLCRSRFSRNALCASALLMPSWPKRRLGDAMPRQETITGVKLSPNGWKHATRCWRHTPRRRPAGTDFDESLHNTLMRIDSAGQAPARA